MTSLYALKPRFQAALRPMVGGLARAGVTANQVTVLAALGSIAVGTIAFAWGRAAPLLFLLIPVWFLLRMALNAADGMLAREFGQKSALGAYLNELCDVVADAALYLPFTHCIPWGVPGVAAVVFLATVSELAGVLGTMVGGERRYDGPMGKSDRALVFAALGAWVGLGGATPEWLGLLWVVLALLIALNIYNRVRAGLHRPNHGKPLQSPEITMRTVEEKNFVTHDGVELFYRHWPAAATPRGAVILLHRGHEHSGRVAHLADELDLPEFSVFAWDARGHGRSPGVRGDSPSVAASVRDLQVFVEHIAATYGIAVQDIAVVAQSVGAVLAATWAHDYAPQIRCMVLASPAFKVKLYVPFALPSLKLLESLWPGRFVNSYVKPKLLTHDPARIASFENDTLVARAISVKILTQLYEAAERVVADARAISVPTQLLISGDDWVVHAGPQHRFFEELGTPIKERHVLPGFYHDTLGERDRASAVGHARRFILDRFADTLQRPVLLEADRWGHTRDEADRLATPLSLGTGRGLYWAMTRFWLKVGGSFSRGIKLGHETGFDSGSSLDYVYRNTPEGLGPIGRLVDRVYLFSIGWRGIRQRKIHAEEMIRSAMTKLRDAGKPVHILDIAAGHGRYVLEALTDGERLPDSILLRDYSPINVEAGNALIHGKALQLVARFVQADAFSTESFAGLEPAPTLGIVSGLYELFPENELVRRSLAGMASAIAEGGYLVYTNQPWHPQLELIARALTSHRQAQAWVMRRRTQEEMDQLVADAGFEKIDQRIDGWGIFTVSLARRRAVA